MTPLRWTRTPPTEAGFWWVRYPIDPYTARTAIVAVDHPIILGRPRITGPLMARDYDGRRARRVDLIKNAEWAGPIAPPEEGS